MTKTLLVFTCINCMMHSAERRFLIKELVVVMVGYLHSLVFTCINCMMHSAERRFLIKELVVVMVGYVNATVSFPVPSYRLNWGILNLIQHKYGINHITKKLHRNKLEFTYEFIGNFHGNIGKLLTTTQQQSAITWKWRRPCHLLDTSDTPSPNNQNSKTQF